MENGVRYKESKAYRQTLISGDKTNKLYKIMTQIKAESNETFYHCSIL